MSTLNQPHFVSLIIYLDFKESLCKFFPVMQGLFVNRIKKSMQNLFSLEEIKWHAVLTILIKNLQWKRNCCRKAFTEKPFCKYNAFKNQNENSYQT